MEFKSPLILWMVFSLSGCAALERWGEAGNAGSVDEPKLGLEGCRFEFARKFTGAYCIDCHSSNGNNPKQSKAIRNLKVDSYQDWLDASGAVPGVLDRKALEAPIMPPPTFRHQPSDSERLIMAGWVRKGSPNSDSGR